MSGIGHLIDSGLGKVEHGVDWGKKKLGEGADWAAHQTGDMLESAGAAGVAHAIEDAGDRFASAMGATVDEQQLGQTEDPKELIHGSPSKICESVKHLNAFEAAFERVGQGMKGLDSWHWQGEAADAFRRKFSMHPAKWLYAAEACAGAAKALESYASTVAWAQGKAHEAASLFKQGKDSSETARDDCNEKAGAYNAKVKAGQDPGPPPAPFSDPGKAQRDRAHEILGEARRQRDEAANLAKTAVTAAMAHAPQKPPPLQRALDEVVDQGVGTTIEVAHIGGGLAKGTADVIDFVRGVNPLDLYNVTHPADYYRHVTMTLAGLASTGAHPDRAASDMWQEFKKDPSDFTGRMVPNFVDPETLAVAGVRATLKVGAKEGLEEGAVLAAEAARAEAKEAPNWSATEEVPRHPPEPHDPLEAAADRSVDIAKLPDHAVWRTTREPLWRFDTRPPDTIFDEGFMPRNRRNTDLEGYVEDNVSSAYVGTTRDPEMGGAQYRYDIDAPGGIDVNKTIPENKYAKEQEIAFPGGVRAEHIKGVWELMPDRTWGNYIPNPHYKPPAPAVPPPVPNDVLPPGWTL
ncbi:putative T7SS-secreted protein [Streptomyces sp. CBMA152]|uniref:putative T7SS-secreted protein n=1 Tax=Streptomyces sp. CBMA152 TaxID=1896312 RepID=UPI001661387E|nr:hypothetical protein [Streptomyces sp. CBMA152]MBD0745613.1 hypothetical protein [Streptomyces sp. CBMA152]